MKAQHRLLLHYLIFIGFLVFILIQGAPTIVEKETAMKIEEIRARTTAFSGFEGFIAWLIAQINIMFLLMTAKTVAGWLSLIIFIPFFVVLGIMLLPHAVDIMRLLTDFIGRIIAGVSGNPIIGTIVGIFVIAGIAGIAFAIGGTIIKVSNQLLAAPEVVCAPTLKLGRGHYEEPCPLFFKAADIDSVSISIPHGCPKTSYRLALDTLPVLVDDLYFKETGTRFADFILSPEELKNYTISLRVTGYTCLIGNVTYIVKARNMDLGQDVGTVNGTFRFY